MKAALAGLGALAAAAAPAAAAEAQAGQAAPRSASAAAPQVQGVTVTGPSQGFRSSIDRRSYSVTGDLQTTTGSIGDALRNVPSVQVDVQGNVTLRGDSVTILVDGRPSALFRGDQAAAIQTFPADQIERVEVITNPSAAESPEGAGGVINLVTRRTFRAGSSGSLRANVGTMGRWNGSLTGAYQSGKVVASGNVNLRHETTKFDTVEARTRIDPATGVRADNLSSGVARTTADNTFIRAAVDYDPTTTFRLGTELSRRGWRTNSTSFDHTESDNAASVLSRVIDRGTAWRQMNEGYEAEITFRKRFTGDQHELTGRINGAWTEDSRLRRTTNASRLPAAGDSFETYDLDGDYTQNQVRLDYNHPIGDARLKAGYLLTLDSNAYHNRGLRGPAPSALSTDPAQTYDFSYRQEVHAVYATYEQPFGDWTVLPGLRLEQADVDVGVQTQGLRAASDYFRVYPSLHLSYRLSETQQLSLSYAMRIQRPRPEDLNPFRAYSDPFNFRQGNPNLKPQETRSIELAWQKRQGQTFYLATAYFRQSTGAITDVVRDLGGGTFLTTRENLNDSRSGGLELVANGRLTSKLSYNLSGDGFWNEIDASALGFAARRSAVGVSGRANLNWNPTANDFFQINGSANGRRLNAQGYTEGFAVMNLGYRRRLSPRLSFIATAQDIFGGSRQRTVYDTAALKGFRRQESSVRGVFIGFTWALGAVQRNQREPGFEFGGGEN